MTFSHKPYSPTDERVIVKRKPGNARDARQNWTLMRKLGTLLSAAAMVSACAVRPEPLSNEELVSSANDRMARVIGADQEPVSGPIDMYEAMSRALKYNLDHRVELKQQAVRAREFDLATYEMLPALVANLEYEGRSNLPGASSITLLTGTPSLEPSRSTERNVADADLTLTWDVLDFAVSYHRARQKGDDVMIALEQRRSAINRTVEDVRTAYWRAVSAQRLEGEIQSLVSRVEAAIAASESVVSDGRVPQMQQLRYQRDLLESLRSLRELSRDLGVSKRQLAALMNLPIGSDYRVVAPRRGTLGPRIPMSADEMLRMAMIYRPELREISYRQRTNEVEAEISELEIIPGFSFFAGLNGSSNRYLYNSNWLEYGARAAWNLMDLARYPRRKSEIAAGSELLDARALALTQAVATQVLVSKMRFEAVRKEWLVAKKHHDVQTRITYQVRDEFNAGRASEQELLREDLNLLDSHLRLDLATADLHSAFANAYASTGLDPYDGLLQGNESVDVIAKSLRSLWGKRGDTLAL